MAKRGGSKKLDNSSTKHSWHKQPKVYLFVGLAVLVVALAASFFPKQADALTVTKTESPICSYGTWVNCKGSTSDGKGYTSTKVEADKKPWQTWKYSFGIVNSARARDDTATINRVRVKVDFWGNNLVSSLNVQVSNDNGKTWGPDHLVVRGNTSTLTEKSYWFDVTKDFSWTPAQLSTSNFRVRATCFQRLTEKDSGCNVDYVPVEVTYTTF